LLTRCFGERIRNSRRTGLLGGSALFRLSGFFRDFDGFIDDTFNGQESDFVEDAGVQGLLGFELPDRTYVDFRARYSDGDYGVGYYENVDFGTLSDESVTPAHNVLPNDENTVLNFSAKIEHEADIGSFIVVASPLARFRNKPRQVLGEFTYRF